MITASAKRLTRRRDFQRTWAHLVDRMTARAVGLHEDEPALCTLILLLGMRAERGAKHQER